MGEQLSEHCWERELRCGHCHAIDGLTNLGPWEQPVNVAELEVVRAAHGKPLPISSGYRCSLHPIEIAKSGGPGPHTMMMAVDWLVSGFDAALLTSALVRSGWKGIGWNQTGPLSSRFVHSDRGPERSWTY